MASRHAVWNSSTRTSSWTSPSFQLDGPCQNGMSHLLYHARKRACQQHGLAACLPVACDLLIKYDTITDIGIAKTALSLLVICPLLGPTPDASVR